MFGELQSIANLAKYPANAPADVPPRATARISSEKRLERFGLLYGACQPMRDLFRGLDRLARSTAPVMPTAPTGIRRRSWMGAATDATPSQVSSTSAA